MRTIHANRFEGGATVGAAHGHAQPRPVIRRKTLAQAVSAALLVMGSGVAMAAAPDNCPSVDGDGLITVEAGATVNRCAINNSGESLIVEVGGAIASTFQAGVYVEDVPGGGFIDIRGTVTGQRYGVQLVESGELLGGLTNSGIINTSGESGGRYGIYLDDRSSIKDGITNNGKIAGDTHGIYIDRTSSVEGGITNNSSVEGVSIRGGEGQIGSGIYIDDNSSIDGGIHNEKGTIAAPATEGFGIRIDDKSTVNGGITNSDKIIAGRFGVLAGSTSSIFGGIANTGTISGGRYGIVFFTSDLNGGITNEEGGTISGGGTYAGIAFRFGSQLQDGITNNGNILGSHDYGIWIDRSSIVEGGIINNGSIQGENTGIFLDTSSIVAGGITNNGSIQGQGSAGVFVDGSSSIVGGITNTDMISGDRDGIVFLTNTELDGGITNTGTISGDTSAGIVFAETSTLKGDITNTGTISGGSFGIGFFTSSELNGGITNSGTIGGGSNSILIDADSTLDFITIAGNNTAQFIGDVEAPDTPVTVASDAVYTIEEAITFNVETFTVAGEMGVDAGTSATITGDFTLSAAGTFRTHVSGNPNYGQLVVAEGPNGSGSSTATLEDGSTIDLQFSDPSTCNGFEVGSVLTEVITADNLTVSGDLNVTSNCESLVFEAQSQNGSVSVEAVGSAGPPAQPPQPVPVNGPWGLVLLALSVLGFGAWRRRAQLKT